jgi:hypothetical protein
MINNPSSFDSLYRSLILENLEAVNFQPNGVIGKNIIFNCLQGVNTDSINIIATFGGTLYTINTNVPNANPSTLTINFIDVSALKNNEFVLTFEVKTLTDSVLTIELQVKGVTTDSVILQGLANNAFDIVLSSTSVNVINAPEYKAPNEIVTNFNGRTGNVVSANNDYSMSQISGVATIAQGGTGQTTQQTALNTLAGNVTSGQYLRGNGTNVIMSAIQAADIPTLNQNTTGSAESFTGNLNGDVSGTQTTTSVKKINGTTLSSLPTGLLKNTTTTGVPTIAIAGTDYVIPSGNITGTASNITATTNATLTTLPNLNLSANSQIVTINNNIALKENIINPGTITQYFRGDKTFQTLDKTAVGLANVDNTSDLNKPISTATQAALNVKSDLTNVYSKIDIDNNIYPNYTRQWFRRSQSSLNLNVSTVPLNCTPFFNASTVTVQGVANPLIYNSATNVISVDPTTNYFYSFSLRIRLNIRLTYSNTGIFFFELRRANNVTVVDTYILTIPTGVGAVNTPTFFSFEINTRIFSGGTDLFQTEGFTLYFYGTPGDTATFAGTDGINFQMIFESN